MANPNFLSMSDDEIMNLDLSTLDMSSTASTEVVTEETKADDETKDDSVDDSSTDTDDSDTKDEDTSKEDTDESEDDSDKEVETSEEVEDTSKKVVDETNTDAVNSQSEVDSTKTETGKKVEPEKESIKTEVNFKDTHEKIFAPFKANGKDFQVQNVDEAISLMQMGANYNKKMAALKPNLKLMKMLENNGLLDESKLNFLIDLDKKDPEAITKLLKEGNIDPLGLDTEKVSNYKPKSYAADDREIAFDEVVEKIKETPTYSRTLSIVAEEWDNGSKQIVASNPELLEAINDHVQRGIYDKIKTEIDRQRMLGGLSGLNDITAYKVVGDQIQERNGFSSQSAKGKANTSSPVIVTPKPKVDDIELKNKKRAVSSTKPASSGGVAKDFNPLAMSDEEFSKMVKPGFI
jgi:hypothetical protein